MRRDSFTTLFPEDLTYDRESRIQKGRKILAVIEDIKGETSKLSCLDVGCSVGIITEFLGDYFKKVVGVDVDEKAIKEAKRRVERNNVSFLVSKENELPAKDASFDVVIFNQVYEHAHRPEVLISEIKRVLKPQGVCYFGARNKYSLFDGHYPIPFISWLPKRVADFLLRIVTDKEEYDIRLLSFSQLNRLTKNFKKHDYTLKVIREPKKFSSEDVVPTALGLNKISWIVAHLLYVFIPNYIWILKKA